MAIHTQLPIHKTGSQLLGLAARIHVQLPRGFKRTIGDKIVTHCSEMVDLMALANATRHVQRAEQHAEGYTRRYPLIEWQWGRDECIAAIERAGLPLPGNRLAGLAHRCKEKRWNF